MTFYRVMNIFALKDSVSDISFADFGAMQCDSGTLLSLEGV